MSIAIRNMLAKHFRIRDGEHEFLFISLIYSTLLMIVFLYILLADKSAFILRY